MTDKRNHAVRSTHAWADARLLTREVFLPTLQYSQRIFGVVCVLVYSLTAGSAACGPKADHLAQLTTAELERLLPGSELSSVRPKQHDGVFQFECDGTWQTHGGRALSGGRYTIRDGAYCIESVKGEVLDCYQVFRDGAGALFLQKSGTDVSTVPMIEVKILPIKKCEMP